MATKPGEANFFPDVPVYPEMGTFQPVYGKFDLTTYIQGASDYEIMAFLVGKYNACLEAYDKVTKLSTDTITAAHQLQDWINTWFDNLDVQQELNNKIDSMVADGSFGTLLHQTFDAQINQQTTSAVTAWLVANVDPKGSAVVVDKSLSIGGAAADSKTVGTTTIRGTKLFNTVTPPSGVYTDLNTIPKNEVVVYIGVNSLVVNLPPKINTIFTVMNYSVNSNQFGGSVQVATDSSHQYVRYATTETEYNDWFVLNQDVGNVQLNSKLLNSQPFEAPYNDLNTIPVNTICTYIGAATGVENKPTGISSVFTVMTYNYHNSSLGGSVQVATDSSHQYVRYATTETEYNDWFVLNQDVGNVQLNSKLLNSQPFEAPYNDLNTIPVNTICTYIGAATGVENKPTGISSVFTVMTYNYHNSSLGGSVQVATDSSNQYVRYATTETEYSPWSTTTSYGFELLYNCGVIGDSYASGATDNNGVVTDHINISWPQICKRHYGCAFENYSFGGATTRTWLTNPNGLAKLNEDESKGCYIIALGINDNAILGSDYLGSITDMHTDPSTNPDTFYGNYGKIIDAIKQKNNSAKIVILNINQYAPGSYVSMYNTAIQAIANKYNLPLMNQAENAHLSSEQYRTSIINNHPTTIEYNRMATAMNELFSLTVLKNIPYFNTYVG